MAESTLEYAQSYFFIGSIGFIFGAALMVNNLVRNKLSFPLAIGVVTACIYGGLLGTRILFVALNNPSLFIEDFPLSIAFWQGGLSWLGGPLLGGAVFLLVMRLAKKPGWANVGSAVPGLAVSHALARTSCLVQGCCYGAPTEVPWAIYSNHLHTMVHPTQIYSMISELVVAAILQLVWWKRPKSRHYLMPLYGVLLASHRFVTESFRGEAPGPEIFAGLRFYQSMCILILVLSLSIILILWNRRRGGLAAGALTIATIVAAVAFHPVAAESNPKPEEAAPLMAESPALETFPPKETNVRPVFLVATRDIFVEALQPWIELRQNQGFNVVVKSWKHSPKERTLSTWIADWNVANVDYILLVGDSGGNDERYTSWHIPSCTNFILRGEQGHSYIYDSPYGDFDHDGCPDVPVGRLPVRTTGELNIQVSKILEFESRSTAVDSYRTVVWTGVDSFDRTMQQVTGKLIEELPEWMEVVRIGGNTFPDARSVIRDQPLAFLNAIQEPTTISFVASHGDPKRIWTQAYQDKRYALSTDDVAILRGKEALAPLFLMACETGRYDTNSKRGPSLAEVFLAREGGPIAVVAASGTMHPMTNYFITRGIMEQLEKSPDTIGDFFLAAQRKAYFSGDRKFIDLVEGDDAAQELLDNYKDNPIANAPRVLQDECLMYNLFGDPATALHLPSGGESILTNAE